MLHICSSLYGVTLFFKFRIEALYSERAFQSSVYILPYQAAHCRLAVFLRVPFSEVLPLSARLDD